MRRPTTYRICSTAQGMAVVACVTRRKVVAVVACVTRSQIIRKADFACVRHRSKILFIISASGRVSRKSVVMCACVTSRAVMTMCARVASITRHIVAVTRDL